MRGRAFCLAAVLTLCAGCTGGDAPALAPAPMAAEEKYVALTFDDGPRADTTGRLLDGLKERGASASFFLIGQQIEGNEALVRRMKAEGHQVGNHTWSHVMLRDAPPDVVRREVERTDALLREVLGAGDYWVRPPYGLLKPEQQAWFPTPLVHWSVDPEDWKSQNTRQVVSAVLNHVSPGDIVLLHDFYPTTVDAALEIVDTLGAQGYVFVTVEELMALYDMEPQPGRFYTDMPD